MIKKSKFPIEKIRFNGDDDEKGRYPFGAEIVTIEGIDKIESVIVNPKTTLKIRNGNNEWQVWIRPIKMEAFVFLSGAKKECINETGIRMHLIVIKGHSNISFEEFEVLFKRVGFFVKKDSIVVRDD